MHKERPEQMHRAAALGQNLQTLATRLMKRRKGVHDSFQHPAPLCPRKPPTAKRSTYARSTEVELGESTILWRRNTSRSMSKLRGARSRELDLHGPSQACGEKTKRIQNTHSTNRSTLFSQNSEGARTSVTSSTWKAKFSTRVA